jgi:hypothetical protein
VSLSNTYIEQKMSNTALDALAGEQILASNSLGTVTNQWVVVRGAGSRSETVISLSHISTVKTIKTSYPGLLVVAGAALLVAAAAASSKQGAGAPLPIALFGFLFVLGYVLSRRASVAFVTGGERIQTAQGGLREAAEFVSALEKALAKLDRDAAA